MTRVLAVLVCVTLAVTSCGGGGGASSAHAPQTLSSTWQAPKVLTYVPADTPYLLATLAPIPRGWRDRMYAGADDKVAELTKMLEQMSPAQRGEQAAWVRAALAVLGELKTKDPKRWMQELGFAEDGTFVIYGISLWPVIRYTVADPARVTHFAQVALDAAGVAVTRGELAGISYWRFDRAEDTVVAALIDHELVASVFPTASANEMLPLVLGVKKPAKSLADTETITALLARYKLDPVSFGFIDLRGAATFAGTLAPTLGPIEPGCREDIQRLVSFVPRVVLGYRKLDASGAQFRMVAELPARAAAALARLRTSVPEVTTGGSGHPLIALGVALSYPDLTPLLRQVAGTLTERPFQCPLFTRLNDAAAEILRIADRPVPPAVRTLRGFSLVVDDFVKDPPAVAGHVTFMGPQVRDLMNMVAMFVPGFAGVTLPADGTPVPLPLGALHVPPTITAHAAATDERLSIAVGEATESRVRDLIAAGLPKHSPLFSLSMDFERWTALGMMNAEKSTMPALREVVMQLDLIGDGVVMDMFMRFGR